MFTGIVTDIGKVRSLEQRADWRCEIETKLDVDAIALGASIACSGVCLTVVGRGATAAGSWFAVEISEETRRATNLSTWRAGTPVNLEQSLKVGEEIGGHIVLGHVDGVGEVRSLTPENGSVRVRIGAPGAIMPMIAEKGSIAVDGVSLTVNAVGDDWFEFNVIPHTKKVTTIGDRTVGERVNLEVDVLARYVARLNVYRPGTSAAR